MKYIKRKIMALLLCLSLTTNQAFAVPVAVPIIFGGVAVVAAIAVMLGYQTTDSSDFHEIYESIEDKVEIDRAKLQSAYVLSTVLVSQIQKGIDNVTGGIKNTVWQFPKKYITDQNNNGQSIALSKLLPIAGSTNYSTGKVLTQGYGYNNPELFISETLPTGAKYTNNLKIGDTYLRLGSLINGNYFVEYSLDKNNWQYCKNSSGNNIGFNKTEYGQRSDSRNTVKVKFSIDNDYKVGLSCIFYNAYNNNSHLYTEYLYRQDGSIINSNTDTTAVTHTNANVPVNQLPVDASKVNGKTFDGTKSYTEADVTYNASDVKITDLTSIDPIVKTPSSGGNTGGTDMSLWDWLKAGIATIIESLRSIPTAVNNIGTNITTAVNALPTAISNIGTNIVIAVNAIPSAVHSIGNDIVGKLNDIPQSIATSIAGAFEGVANLSINMSNDLKNLFIPDPTLLQQKYNKLSLDFSNKLGVIRQSFDIMFKLVAQDFKVKQPSLKITLYPPYGDGSTVELVDWSFFNQYWQTYQNIASAIVWFLFFRKVVINSNEYFGGGKWLTLNL